MIPPELIHDLYNLLAAAQKKKLEYHVWFVGDAEYAKLTARVRAVADCIEIVEGYLGKAKEKA